MTSKQNNKSLRTTITWTFLKALSENGTINAFLSGSVVIVGAFIAFFNEQTIFCFDKNDYLLVISWFLSLFSYLVWVGFNIFVLNKIPPVIYEYQSAADYLQYCQLTAESEDKYYSTVNEFLEYYANQNRISEASSIAIRAIMLLIIMSSIFALILFLQAFCVSPLQTNQPDLDPVLNPAKVQCLD